MIVFDKKKDLIAVLSEKKALNSSIGFVPTMGALHDGHLSLIERAKGENDCVVASIFVNPTQFNNPDDLKNYPRTIETDKVQLDKVKTDILFFPSTDEIYPAHDTDTPAYDFGILEKVMEGKHRPGHFNGVAQVVSKLFRIVNPDAAYFGEKDFQQLAVIRELVKKINAPIKIVGCPTMRESSGLAMSSRNTLLSKEEREEASKISKVLFFIRDHWKEHTMNEIVQRAIEMIQQSGMMQVEYLEIAEEETLQSVSDWNFSKPIRSFAAVKLGKVRLIDNVPIR